MGNSIWLLILLLLFGNGNGCNNGCADGLLPGCIIGYLLGQYCPGLLGNNAATAL